MPDIREILNALSIDHRALWSEQRTIMRRSYLNAHNETVGMANWMHEDDAFLDLIDIRLALLFDRAGLLNTTKSIIDTDLADKTEQDLIVRDAQMKTNIGGINMTEASKKLMEGFNNDVEKLANVNGGWSSNV